MFRKEFPTAKLNPTLLRKIYGLHKIKKKKIRWYKQGKEQGADQAQAYLNNMKNRLVRLKRQGYRIVYIDETVFTRKTVKDREWTAPKSNLAVDLVRLNEPVLCLLPGISKEKGWEYYRIFPKSVN